MLCTSDRQGGETVPFQSSPRNGLCAVQRLAGTTVKLLFCVGGYFFSSWRFPLPSHHPALPLACIVRSTTPPAPLGIVPLPPRYTDVTFVPDPLSYKRLWAACSWFHRRVARPFMPHMVAVSLVRAAVSVSWAQRSPLARVRVSVAAVMRGGRRRPDRWRVAAGL